MIIMTLGTVSFQFNRAIIWLSILLERGMISEPVFLQYGNSDTSPVAGHPLVTLEQTVTSAQLTKLVDASSLVISHAGQGSTKMLAERGAHFVLIPRLKRYGEHVDDHQLWFAQSVASYRIQSILSLQELEKVVLQPPPHFQGKLFNGPKLTEYLLTQYPPEKQTYQWIS
ncbi:MAG: glycosyl transferase [Scytonema sp. RU_4_4]|nr:glycosyl transferase [Scytonema sp. RU_4_4]NJR73589.1 glycosyl transferase [Scytonema sp. CRU_2_7]